MAAGGGGGGEGNMLGECCGWGKGIERVRVRV